MCWAWLSLSFFLLQLRWSKSECRHTKFYKITHKLYVQVIRDNQCPQKNIYTKHLLVYNGERLLLTKGGTGSLKFCVCQSHNLIARIQLIYFKVPSKRGKSSFSLTINRNKRAREFCALTLQTLSNY